ncbi:MAG TPA: hypothetical protein VLJ37_09010 [bacterium]|nr:hypothetical protein [bacterium]
MANQNPQTPETQTQTVQKKKIPGWAKFLIVIAILGVVGLTVVGIGLRILAGFLTSKAGEYATEEGIKHGIEKIMETGMKQAGMGDTKVNITDNGLVLKDEKTGQQIAIKTDQKLPDGFPSDIPVFSPSQVTGSMILGAMTMVTLESSSSVTDVSNFYQRELVTGGWQSAIAVPPSDTSYSGIFKKGTTALTVSANREGDKTNLILSYGSAEQPPPQP